jgi:hypothetical protein
MCYQEEDWHYALSQQDSSTNTCSSSVAQNDTDFLGYETCLALGFEEAGWICNQADEECQPLLAHHEYN